MLPAYKLNGRISLAFYVYFLETPPKFGGLCSEPIAGKLNWHKDKLTTESSAQSTECLNLYGPTRQSSLVSFYSRRFILDASLRFGQSQKPYDLYYSSLWRNWRGRLLCCQLFMPFKFVMPILCLFVVLWPNFYL